MGLAPELKSFFPDARLVHLHRNRHETALSMREYAVLRLAVPVMHGEFGEVVYSHDGLVAFERGNREAIDRILASRPPVELYGRYWSEQGARGLPVLEQVDPDDVLHVRFEELVTDPRPVMSRIADFFEILPGDWLDSACAFAKGLPPTRFDRLGADEQRRFSEACRPGMELLERHERDSRSRFR
jgi:putative sulfotransferase